MKTGTGLIVVITLGAVIYLIVNNKGEPEPQRFYIGQTVWFDTGYNQYQTEIYDIRFNESGNYWEYQTSFGWGDGSKLLEYVV